MLIFFLSSIFFAVFFFCFCFLYAQQRHKLEEHARLVYPSVTLSILWVLSCIQPRVAFSTVALLMALRVVTAKAMGRLARILTVIRTALVMFIRGLYFLVRARAESTNKSPPARTIHNPTT